MLFQERTWIWDESMRTFLAWWTTLRDCVNTVALMDVYDHFDEADPMVRMLVPEHQFT